MLNEEWRGQDSILVGKELFSGFSGKRGPCWREGSSFLERTPVLPGTLFGLELLSQEAHIDFRLAVELLLSDVGAVIQVLNRAGREEIRTAGLPDRIEECLISLDLGELLNSLYSKTIALGAGYEDVAAVWEHCRAIARYASITAESTGEITAEDAYLAGLLDDRGAIAAVLGWPLKGPHWPGAGELLCAGDMLPGRVVAAFGRVPDFQRPMEWKYILDTARKLAGPQKAPIHSSGALQKH